MMRMALPGVPLLGGVPVPFKVGTGVYWPCAVRYCPRIMLRVRYKLSGTDRASSYAVLCTVWY
eukprot:3811538-Rhodomonas_salina.2